MNRTALAINMLIYLKANGLTKKQELADFLETNVRNIKELRNELEVAGYHIESKTGPHGGYLLHDSSFFPLSNLQSDHRQALIDAASTLLSSQQTHLGKTFKEAYLQLIANEKITTIIQSSPTKLAMSNETIENYIRVIQEAINQTKRVNITYQRSLTTTKDYIFEPYECIVVNGLWYVVGYIKDEHWASLKINRFIEINPLDQTYLVDTSFNTTSLLHEFGFKFNDIIELKLIIKNHPYVSEYIYGPNQLITILDENTLKIQFEMDSRTRAQTFVLQFGSDCEVISPLWLKDYQKQQAQTIINR